MTWGLRAVRAWGFGLGRFRGLGLSDSTVLGFWGFGFYGSRLLSATRRLMPTIISLLIT